MAPENDERDRFANHVGVSNLNCDTNQNGFGSKPKGNGFSYRDPVTGRIWKKVLYEQNPFPDNFTPDECFLAAIERNKNLHSYTFTQCLQGSCQVALQACAVILFGTIYNFLDSNWITSEAVLMSVAASTLTGYLIFETFFSCQKNRSRRNDFKHVMIFVSFGLGLAPVLYKLTDTISTDTIHSTTTAMLFIHLALHDYGLQVAVVSRALSLNAALFAAVCLASRMKTSFDAFVLLSVAVELFVLFPMVRKHLENISLLTVTSIAAASSVALTACLAISVSVMALIGLLIVILVCPMLFVHWQSFKTTIHGPWDEAVPSI